MAKDAPSLDMDLSAIQRPAIRYLIESALKSLVSDHADELPSNREDWIDRLGEALMARSDMEHEHVLSAMIANGVTSEELYQHFIPAASRYLGEKWVSDEASFVDVTTGAARLQSLFRQGPDGPDKGHILNRTIPLGDSVLMIIPQFEQHSLGAFVAADGMRRKGLWVRLAIGMTDAEIATLLASNRFSMVGLSLATWKSVEKAAGLIEYVRKNLDNVPPIVIGGRVVEDREKIEHRSGADFAVMSVREAIERCGLAMVTDLAAADGVL